MMRQNEDSDPDSVSAGLLAIKTITAPLNRYHALVCENQHDSSLTGASFLTITVCTETPISRAHFRGLPSCDSRLNLPVCCR